MSLISKVTFLKGWQGGQVVLGQMFEDVVSLTVVLVVEDNELLPCVLHHDVENDIVKVDRWPHEERVVIRLAWAGRGAAGAWGTRWCPLDEQMWDVHGVSQRLQRTCRHAANGAH